MAADEHVGSTLRTSTDCPNEITLDADISESLSKNSAHSKRRKMSWRFESLKDLNLNPAFRIVSINLFQGPSRVLNIGLFYKMCIESTHLHVTTSCFTVWKKHKYINGYAKMIPALPVKPVSDGADDGQLRVCIFFFDDNIEWGGTEDSPGICNLRDLETGDFVDFCGGRNGFTRDYFARHTVIHHSTKYRNILVKANILDALEDTEYFCNIIFKYAKPGEKILVFMDVNSTIVCNDTSEGKDVSGSLLSSMFELIEATPRDAVDFIWDPYPPMRLEKKISLKQMVKKFTGGAKEDYVGFFKADTCRDLLEKLAPIADLRWSSQCGEVDAKSFADMYERYLSVVNIKLCLGGITKSWFRCFEALQAGKHTVVLNSYGVDTRKVVVSTVSDERQVMQITVNYELWSDQDVEKFEEQYREASPQVVPVGTNWFTRTFFPSCCGHTSQCAA